MDSAEKACDDPLERISNVHRPVGSNSERWPLHFRCKVPNPHNIFRLRRYQNGIN